MIVFSLPFSTTQGVSGTEKGVSVGGCNGKGPRTYLHPCVLTQDQSSYTHLNEGSTGVYMEGV